MCALLVVFARVRVLACSLIKQMHFEQEREAWTADQRCRTKTLLIERLFQTTAPCNLFYVLRFALWSVPVCRHGVRIPNSYFSYPRSKRCSSYVGWLEFPTFVSICVSACWSRVGPNSGTRKIDCLDFRWFSSMPLPSWLVPVTALAEEEC